MADNHPVRQALKSGPPVKIPAPHDRVYKDECMFSYDTSLSPGGLYISLSSWQAFGKKFVALDHQRTKNLLYLHETAFKVPVAQEANGSSQTPERLAIGGQGGFQVDESKFTIVREHSLLVIPDNKIPLPNADLPEIVLQAIAAILAHQGSSLQDETAAWEEDRVESKYAANLAQLPDGMGRYGRSIPSDPSKWRCDETGVTENLWLNLSTGFIGSGRQNWDGSGGNGAAVRHYEATGKQFPLAVKLGTITPRGADVYSYAEDDMVTDAKLGEHLSHWGINMMDLEKTEKTMAELQIDLNLSYEFDKITESGSKLQPLSGPGYVGLKNLGNSCYMNSILQLLWIIPNVQQRYLTAAELIFTSAPEDPALDLSTQMAKIGVALCQAKTGGPENVQHSEEETTGSRQNGAAEQEELSVKPQSFKSLVGKGHAEFSSGRQQDASEYFQYLLDVIAKSERVSEQRLGNVATVEPTAAAFEFATETRIQCQESRRVSYKRDAATNLLSLSIPMGAATNKNDVQQYEERQAKRAKLKESNVVAYISQDGSANGTVTSEHEEKILPRVPLSACLHDWQADEQMLDYFSAALNRKTQASKRNRFATFPPYLMIQLNRFYLASDWTARKLEVLVDVPTYLDLEHLRSKGLQPGEMEQPQDPAAKGDGTAETVEADPSIVESLKQMGFSENGSKRAAVATKNGGTEVAMEWVLGHMEDPDFNDPIQPPASSTSSFNANPESVAMLSSMGFNERQATAALKACQGSLERAADWLFSHAAELDSAVDEVLTEAQTPDTATPSASSNKALEDGPGRYKLQGFVSHMGANTACGHYVCHMFKEGRWVIYNDEKVAVSENPPIELGYLYLFKREDVA